MCHRMMRSRTERYCKVVGNAIKMAIEVVAEAVSSLAAAANESAKEQTERNDLKY